MKDNVTIALLVLVLFAVLFQPQLNETLTGKYTSVAEKTAIPCDFNDNGVYEWTDYRTHLKKIEMNSWNYNKRYDCDGDGDNDVRDLALLRIWIEEEAEGYYGGMKYPR